MELLPIRVQDNPTIASTVKMIPNEHEVFSKVNAPTSSVRKLIRNSIGGIASEYDVIFENFELGIEIQLDSLNRIVVKSINNSTIFIEENKDLIAPGDILMQIGEIYLRNRVFTIEEVEDLFFVLPRPLCVIFESSMALQCVNALEYISSLIYFDPCGPIESFDITNDGMRELIFHSPLEAPSIGSFGLESILSSAPPLAHVILFDDMLLITKPTPGNKLLIKHVWMLEDLRVRDLIALPKYKSFSFEVLHTFINEKTGRSDIESFTFIASSEQSKSEWISYIASAITTSILSSTDDAKKSYFLNKGRGWHHYLCLGTLHSCARLGDAEGIKRIYNYYSTESEFKLKNRFSLKSKLSLKNELKLEVNSKIQKLSELEDIENSSHQLHMKFDLDALDSYGTFPLLYAAISGSRECIRLLYDLGCDVNKVDSKNQFSALHAACLYLKPSAADELLRVGANIDSRDIYHRTPLFLCGINEDEFSKSGIIGDGISERKVVYFDYRNAKLCIELLQKRGANVDEEDIEGMTVLEHNVCVNVEKCRVLLECNASINSVFEGGNTLLHIACNNFSRPKYLFAVDEIDSSTSKALDKLLEIDVDPSIISLLLQYGAQPNICNENGETPLHILFSSHKGCSGNDTFSNKQHHIVSAEVLLRHGARIDIKDEKGVKVEQFINDYVASRDTDKLRKMWKKDNRVLATPNVVAKSSKKSVVDKKQCKNCFLCRALFGLVQNTKQTCCCCGKIICNKCSNKKLCLPSNKPGTGQYNVPDSNSLSSKRVCDGCFNFAFYDIGREEEKEQQLRRLLGEKNEDNRRRSIF